MKEVIEDSVHLPSQENKTERTSTGTQKKYDPSKRKDNRRSFNEHGDGSYRSTIGSGKDFA